MAESSGPDSGDVRVSDAERQAVVDRLSSATGDGLLSLDEFADAAGAAYAAVTRAQLDAVTRDLRLPVPLSDLAPPAPPGGTPAGLAGDADRPTPGRTGAPATKRRWVVAVMGGEDRRGSWRVARRIGAFALMGGVDLDLRDAVLEGDDIEITAWAIMGGVTVVVPEGIPVEFEGFVLMGGRSNRIKEMPPLPGAPRIRVRGYGMWGGIDVRSKPPRTTSGRQGRDQRRGERRDARRDRHRDGLDHGGPAGLPTIPGLPVQPFGAAMPPVPPVPPTPPVPPAPPVPAAPAAPAAGPSSPGMPGSAVHAGRSPQGGLVTIVCTDIVGSTRYADTLGDQRWRGVLLAHNALVREQLAKHGGTEVKTSGDGFLVSFPSSRSAVQFAVGVQDALADYRSGHPDTPLEVRIGVHAGEVERDGDDLVGRNVTIACRLCDVAAPGEVLASAVVADLTDSASDLAFGPPREHNLAGIERPVGACSASRR